MSTYKPGDVAMVTAQWKRGIRETAPAVLRGSGWERIEDGAIAYCGDALDARPLVVIDPDDINSLREIVQQMNVHRPGELITPTVTKLQAALREFATPTPPLCGDHLSITGDKDRPVSYTCTLNAGHDGAHHDAPATTAWRQTSTRADA